MGVIHGKQKYFLLIVFWVKGILAGDWSVRIPSGPISAVVGSSVVLPCSYDYPQTSKETKGRLTAQVTGSEEVADYKVLNEMWCLKDSRCITQRYVFHSAGIFPDPSFQNRVEYLGQSGSKNCSLRINDLKQTDNGTYVFYLITNHPTEKMPAQAGVQLLVTAPIPFHSTQSKVLVIGVSVGILLAILATVAFLIMRRQKSTRHQSYILTETITTQP